MDDLEILRDEQLNKDLDALLDKYGIYYAQKIKTLLNVKIERRKFELQLMRDKLEKESRNSHDSNLNNRIMR